ncbi:hypothetical protein JOQ06_026041, partial [Pogonophryne albipinna]
MAVNWPGLVSIGVFYIIVLGTGIWASRKSKREEKKCSGNRSEVAMVGGRNLNIYVSIFTMTATWVGGGYILGSAEMVYDPTKGLVWAVAPLACSMSLIIGGLFFVKPIRSKNYVTIMDPFQEKYGNKVSAVLFIPLSLGTSCGLHVFWCTGGLEINLVTEELQKEGCTAISASGDADVDIVKWLCVPFILASPSSANFTVAAVTKLHQEPWIGRLELEDAGRWVENILLIAIGLICYQAFYQRVLSTATDAQAKITCYAAAVFCPILGIPSILIGAVAAST